MCDYNSLYSPAEGSTAPKTQDDLAVTTGEDPLITTTTADEPEASTEGPVVTGSPSGESENGAVGSTVDPVGFDQPTGSGMQPPEEGAASSTAPVEEPEEAHPTYTNDYHVEPSDSEDYTTEGKKNTSKNISNTSMLQYSCWLNSIGKFFWDCSISQGSCYFIYHLFIQKRNHRKL